LEKFLFLHYSSLLPAGNTPKREKHEVFNQWSATEHEKLFFLVHSSKLISFSSSFQQVLFYPVYSPVATNRFYRSFFNPVASILLIFPVGAMLAIAGWLSAAVYRTRKFHGGVMHLPVMTDQKQKVLKGKSSSKALIVGKSTNTLIVRNSQNFSI
jgi:hypothetical protein